MPYKHSGEQELPYHEKQASVSTNEYPEEGQFEDPPLVSGLLHKRGEAYQPRNISRQV